jgi:hypothetical protein
MIHRAEAAASSVNTCTLALSRLAVLEAECRASLHCDLAGRTLTCLVDSGQGPACRHAPRRRRSPLAPAASASTSAATRRAKDYRGAESFASESVHRTLCFEQCITS